MENLYDMLKENAYPGRGIVIGTSACGRFAVIAYFIMGRSENSRNRVFVNDGEGIRTEAFDPSKLTDPSLIIYSPVRVMDKITIVTNGDQTDTVYDTLISGGTFEDALRSRTFEPDLPNFTPRISGMVSMCDSFTYKLSILKSAEGDPRSVRRFFFDYDTPLKGQGHFIHTYKCDGDPIPSFTGEPKVVELSDDIDSFAHKIYDSLNADNKVSLFTRYIDLGTGECDTRIINKNH